MRRLMNFVNDVVWLLVGILLIIVISGVIYYVVKLMWEGRYACS